MLVEIYYDVGFWVLCWVLARGALVFGFLGFVTWGSLDFGCWLWIGAWVLFLELWLLVALSCWIFGF